MRIDIDWNSFKDLMNSKKLTPTYLDLNDIYYIAIRTKEFLVVCQIQKTDPKEEIQLEFETSYLSKASRIYSNNGIDTLFHYELNCLEMKCSTLNGGKSLGTSNEDLGLIQTKCYDANNQLIEENGDFTQCVKTIFSYRPTFNYQLTSALCSQTASPSVNCRLHAVFAPGLLDTKFTTSGLNLKNVPPTMYLVGDSHIPTISNYIPQFPSANGIDFIVLHDINCQHEFNIILALYKS